MIKTLLQKSLMFKSFDPTLPSILYCDASKYGAASMLMQAESHEGKKCLYPIAFYSVQFNSTQQNYATVERELWAILNTLEKAKLMLSTSISIFTDNQGIISIGRSERSTHARLTKSLDLLNIYNLRWTYLPGIRKYVADYLSRYGLDDQPVLDLDKWDNTCTFINVQKSQPQLYSTAADTPPNDTPTIDEDFVFTNQTDLTWTDNISIRRLLIDRSPITDRFKKIFDSFTIQNETLYHIINNPLATVLIDADYLS